MNFCFREYYLYLPDIKHYDRLAPADELPAVVLAERDLHGRQVRRQVRAAGLHPPPLSREGLSGAERHADQHLPRVAGPGKVIDLTRLCLLDMTSPGYTSHPSPPVSSPVPGTSCSWTSGCTATPSCPTTPGRMRS